MLYVVVSLSLFFLLCMWAWCISGIYPTYYVICFDMPNYMFLSWNVKGLGNSAKKRKILAFLKENKINLAYLQETHLLSSAHDYLKSKWFGKVYCSTFTSSSRGGAILISKNVPFFPEEIKMDPYGRYIFVRGFLAQEEIILLNSYSTNYDDPKFINDLYSLLLNYDIPVFWGGDFNCVLDAKLDGSSQSKYSLSKMSTALNNSTRDLGIYEVWRTLHPDEIAFSFYSHVHKSYSRIDFFFIPVYYMSRLKIVLIMLEFSQTTLR